MTDHKMINYTELTTAILEGEECGQVKKVAARVEHA